MMPVNRPVIAPTRVLVIVVLGFCTTSEALACCNNWQEYAAYCRSTGGNPVTNPPRCLPAAGNSAVDISADLQELTRQQAAEQAREEQLKSEEEERARQAEEARRLKEQQQQHAAFIKERDSTVLKGDTGTHAFGIGGLKGIDSTDSGLKGVSAAKPAKEPRDLSGPNAAWKQLNCAAAIAGNAIAALQSALDGKSDERDEFKYLSSESSKALAGETLGVVCPATRALPSRNGQPVDVDKGTIALKQILDRAAKVAERLRAPLPSSPAQTTSAGISPGNGGDELSKLRDTQLALNQINERKYDSTSQDAINREKQTKREAGALLLAAQKVQTGDFSIDLSETGSSSPSRSSKNSEKQ
jgi:hypothetical protein